MSYLATVLFAACAPLVTASVVDPSTRYQTWEGFGTSLAWWAHVVGAYKEPLRSELVDKVLRELRLNVLRYNIGGGEAPGHETMESRARVPGYLGPDGRYEWSADSAQRWVLERGLRSGANVLEAFSNSPPYQMTVSGSVTGAAGGTSNLDPAHVDAFADYLATVVQHFQDVWGVQFSTLEPMNEPSANWWTLGGRQEGCHVSAGPEQSALILSTARALRGHGLTTQVSASDENSNTEAVHSWKALSQLAREVVAQVNTHSYWGNSQTSLRQAVEKTGKRIWMSEYGDGDATGMRMARQIVTDIRKLQPTAWVYWQVIDGGGGWGCIDLDLNARATSFTVNRKYYIYAQFTQFIEPGATFIDVDDPNSVAAVRAERLVLVTVRGAAGTVAFDLTRFGAVGARASVYQTSELGNLVRLPDAAVTHGSVSVDVPARSVTTIVIDGCRVRGA